MTALQPLFDSAVADIEAAYARLGHRLGWRFLLVPRRTFTSGVRTMLLSFHPGGDVEPDDQPKASSEAGSAYDIESWGGAPPGAAPLQQQVRELLHAFGETTDGTLSAYLVPFRAPRKEDLASRKESLDFALRLWGRLLPELNPQVVIALGEDAYAGVIEVFGKPSREDRRSAGWGAQSISLVQVGTHLVVRVPHLSQFKLMSRPEGRAAIEGVARSVAAFRAGQDWWREGAPAPATGSPSLPPVPASTLTRLEKAALDNGFDLTMAPHQSWLPAGSSHAPLDVWLTADAGGQLVAAFSRPDLAGALADLGAPTAVPLPAGAAAALKVADIGELHRLLRRAYQLARSLPNEPLRDFQQKTATLPRTTEAERLVIQRVGQDIFRAGLMDYWEGKCAITGLAVPELLRASHIKPWADCETDAERLDVFNGLLLAPHLDAAFDQGFITVADDGAVILSGALGQEERGLLGLARVLRVGKLADGHRAFLPWHRSKIFRP
jgi:putative restriction endonuclease